MGGSRSEEWRCKFGGNANTSRSVPQRSNSSARLCNWVPDCCAASVFSGVALDSTASQLGELNRRRKDIRYRYDRGHEDLGGATGRGCQNGGLQAGRREGVARKREAIFTRRLPIWGAGFGSTQVRARSVSTCRHRRLSSRMCDLQWSSSSGPRRSAYSTIRRWRRT